MSIRVLLVDDQAPVRAGLRLVLESTPDLLVVGEAADGAQALEVVGPTAPDVVLMDVRMPGMDGITATRLITTHDATAGESPGRAGPHVVILTTYDLDEYVFDALAAGASGFLLKHAPPEELVYGVRAAASGDGLVSPSVTRRLVAEFAASRRRRPQPTALARLTPREREVLDLVAAGLSNTEIAVRLFVAESTVKTHVAHLLTKLDLRDRVHAVIYAYEHGLIAPAPSPKSSPG